LEYVDERGVPTTEFVREGKDLLEALQNMDKYLALKEGKENKDEQERIQKSIQES